MRLYVLCYSDYTGIEPHIVAEVVHDALDKDLHTTLADSLAGDRAVIMSRAELLADPVYSSALRAWERKDDKEFDEESDFMRDEDETPAAPRPQRKLHLVPRASGSSGG
jgi:hypothetical protein